MRICPNCNNTSQEAINFCPKCGTAMVEQAPPAPPVQPVYQEPVQPQYQYQYQYQQPTYNAMPAPSKGKIITSMVLSAAGLGIAGLGFLYTFLFMVAEVLEAAFAFGFIFSFISLPLSLVGLILSNGCINAGSTSPMSRIGKILGLVGVIVSGVMFLFAIISAGSF